MGFVYMTTKTNMWDKDLAFLGGIVFFVLMFATIYYFQHWARTSIPRDRFDNLQIGMSLSQVEDILGNKHEPFYSTTVDGARIQKFDYVEEFHSYKNLYDWPRVVLVFRDGKLEEIVRNARFPTHGRGGRDPEARYP